MAAPTQRQTMSWLVAVEDYPSRAHVMRGGFGLTQAATQDGLIDVGDEDGFALAILELHERQLIQ